MWQHISKNVGGLTPPKLYQNFITNFCKCGYQLSHCVNFHKYGCQSCCQDFSPQVLQSLVSELFIHCKVENPSSWFVTFVTIAYGINEALNRCSLWNDLYSWVGIIKNLGYSLVISIYYRGQNNSIVIVIET